MTHCWCPLEEEWCTQAENAPPLCQCEENSTSLALWHILGVSRRKNTPYLVLAGGRMTYPGCLWEEETAAHWYQCKKECHIIISLASVVTYLRSSFMYSMLLPVSVRSGTELCTYCWAADFLVFLHPMSMGRWRLLIIAQWQIIT